MPNDKTKRRFDESGAEDPAEKRQQHEATQSLRELEERKMDDHLSRNNESMSQVMSVQALLNRGIGDVALLQVSSQNQLTTGIRSNAALHILSHERARAALQHNLWASPPDLAYRNVTNASGANRAFLAEIPHSFGVSPIVSDYLLSDNNRRMGVAITNHTSLAASLPALPPAATSGLSQLQLEQVLSRASVLNYQRNLDQALAIIRENETARRVRQLQLSQGTQWVRPNLFSAVIWENAQRQQIAPQNPICDPIQTAQRSLSLQTDASSVNSTEALNRTRAAVSALGTRQGSVGLSQSIAGNVGSTRRHDSSGVLLATDEDEKNLSEYQTLVRKQLEFFEASEEDVSLTTQGRKKVVYIGQVGIRCIHCAHRPANLRSRGSVYFPSKLSSVYQAAQNMAVSHLMDACDEIDEGTRQQLSSLRSRKDTAAGGKAYWALSCAKVGVSETETGLRLTNPLR
ncbi:hypothetical protein FisN_6Lh303 [Fistulifera solaris]|uniref:Uncharacterized protein n=1 Tax=Fistulifera solaris TaxID=1519565 RepID=A0A1Z5J674_FISSO|nr:hypothetical protein FisN_6Lh303 [Fistulifera solaris]|eukprot:GAX09328.1 hypothetical protein FisN_6Lh303 [Fistulifera solaris]